MSSTTDTLQMSLQEGIGEAALSAAALTELGKIVSNAESLEFHVTALLGVLVGCDLTIAFICFSGVSAAAKRDLVRNLATQRFGKGLQTKARILDAMKRHEQITGQRNKIVHATWKVEGGEWKRAFINTSVAQLDTLIGGYPDREQKTQAAREKYEFSMSDMGDVLDGCVALAEEIKEITAIVSRSAN